MNTIVTYYGLSQNINFDVQSNDVTCKEAKNGSIIIIPKFKRLEFALNNNAFSTNTSYINLSEGEYNLYSKDSLGIINKTTITIKVKSKLDFTTSFKDITCSSYQNGEINVQVVNGDPPLLFGLKDQTNNFIENFSSSNNFNKLKEGAYTVVVKDALNCTLEKNITIKSSPKINLNAISTPVTMLGANDGKIVMNVIGGISPYVFSINQKDFTNNSTFTNLSDGNYILSVKDGNGCIENISVYISTNGDFSRIVIKDDRDKFISLIMKEIENNNKRLKNIKHYYNGTWIGGLVCGAGGTIISLVVPISTAAVITQITSTLSGTTSTIVGNLKFKEEIKCRKKLKQYLNPIPDIFNTNWSDIQLPQEGKTWTEKQYFKYKNEKDTILMRIQNYGCDN